VGVGVYAELLAILRDAMLCMQRAASGDEHKLHGIGLSNALRCRADGYARSDDGSGILWCDNSTIVLREILDARTRLTR
jgi:hypothetical protein